MKEENKGQRLSRRILIITGIMLLVFGMTILISSFFTSKKKLASDIDESMRRRAEKIKTLNRATARNINGHLNEVYIQTLEGVAVSYDGDSDDADQDEVVMDDGESYEIEGEVEHSDGEWEISYDTNKSWVVYVPDYSAISAYTDYTEQYSFVDENGDVNSVATESQEKKKKEFIAEYDYGYYSSDDEISLYGLIPKVRDLDGDWIVFVDQCLYVAPGGYFYTERLSTGAGRLAKDFAPANYLSGRNNDLYNDGQAYIEKGKTNGWDGDFRYYVFSDEIMAAPVDNLYLDYLYADQVYAENPYNIAGFDEYNKTVEQYLADNGYQSYVINSVMFYDATEALQTLRKHTIWNTGVFVLFYVVIMGVLFMLLRPFILNSPQEEKEEAAEKTEDLRIPDAVAKELLSRINDTETSMGPNGYLDQLRLFVENKTDRPGTDGEEKEKNEEQE